MNTQSTPSQTPRESLNIPGRGNNPLSTPGASQRPSIDEPPDIKSAILNLIENTRWPSKASAAQQNLLRTVKNAADTPEATTQLPPGEKDAMDEFIEALGRVRDRLKDVSTKYGKKDLRKRDKLKKMLRGSPPDGDCIRDLKECQSAIEAAGDRLRERSQAVGEQETNSASQSSDATQATQASTQNIPSSGQANQPEVKGNSQLSQALTTAKAIFTAVEAFSGPIPIAGQYIGGAAKLGLAIVDMWKGMDSNTDAAKSLETRIATLADHLKYFESEPRVDQKKETSKIIQNLQLQLELVEREIKALDSKHVISKAFFSRDNTESLKEFQEQVKAAEGELHVREPLLMVYASPLLTSSFTAAHQLWHQQYRKQTLYVPSCIQLRFSLTDASLDDAALLDRLGDGNYGAHGNTIEDATCLKGTREEILQRVDDWFHDTSSERALWIYGQAGKGKSTIAATVAHRRRDRSMSAVFHFRRGQTALEKRLVCALAKQLESCATLGVRLALLQAIEEKKDIAQGRLDEQFEILLVNPLKDYPAESPPILLTIDALDECEDIDYARRFIELIDQYSSVLPQNIKFFLTTRPEPPIVETLRSKEWRTENLDQATEVQHDVKLFIEAEFSKIRRLKSGLPADWPSPGAVQQLVASSEGLFQWARTAVGYIGSGPPTHRLNEVLEDSSELRGLDNLYQQILLAAIQKAGGNSRVRLLRRAFAVLVAAPYPISLEVMAYLFGNDEALRNKTKMDACTFIRDDVLSNVASLL
ncbi:hypothetical protein FRC01_006469, partial [Tulasnella sp. 417]